MKKNAVYDVCIAGAGAGGLAAGISALRNGASACILEHTGEPGKKLLLTGNGHCNLTNRELSEEHYFGDRDFVRTVLGICGAAETEAFFRSISVPLRTRHYGYDDSAPVYPEHMSARLVRDALLSEYLSAGGVLRTGVRIAGIAKTKDGFLLETGEGAVSCRKLILACGSNAAPKTGSDSSCYALVKGLGHSFRTFVPALCALKTDDPGLKLLAGERHVSAVRDAAGGKGYYGEVQFNDGNLSGVPVLNLSAYLAAEYGRDVKGRELVLDLFPDLEKAELAGYLDEVFRRAEQTGRRPEELFRLGFGEKAAAFLALSGAFEKERRTRTAETAADLKEVHFRITGTAGFDRSQACAGGIPTAEIDPVTMESKLVQGLHFAGELTDVLGECGGYNLQWAWSTGLTAGRAAAPAARNELKRKAK